MEGSAASVDIDRASNSHGGEKKERLFKGRFTQGGKAHKYKQKRKVKHSAAESGEDEGAELSDHSILAPAKKARTAAKDETITISSAEEDSNDEEDDEEYAEEDEEESAPAIAVSQALEKTTDASATMLASTAATRVSQHEMLELNVDEIRDSGRLCVVITALRSRNRIQESMLDTKRNELKKERNASEEGQKKLEELKTASRKERSGLEAKVEKLEGKVAAMGRVPRSVPVEAFDGTFGGQQNVSELRNELRSIKRQLKKEQDDNEHLQATIMLHHDELLSERLANEHLEKDVEDAKTEISQLQAEVGGLNTMIDASKSMIETLRKDHDGLQVDILAMTKENSIYLKQLVKKQG